MRRLYLIIGVLICVLFTYSWVTGARLFDADANAQSKPKGPGQYHK